ncbi:MAG: GW dipeptide domain-containing protein [Candidatus Hermodarchaeota archaeon]
MNRKVTVVKSHHSEVLIPFQAEKGEIVKGKEKPTQWEGWLYCKNNAGIYGWVPKAFVIPIVGSSENFQFIRSYNAFEITALKGESVLIKETESGWALVENKDRKVGWIPLENLEVTDL